MASGLCAALTGRTHGCTDQPANVKKTLANSEPSTHGTKRTCAADSHRGSSSLLTRSGQEQALLLQCTALTCYS